MSQTSAVRDGLPTPASLAELLLSTRQLLTEQVGECLQVQVYFILLARYVAQHFILSIHFVSVLSI